MNNFWKRVITGAIILLTVILVPYFFENKGIIILLTFLSVVGLREFLGIFKNENINRHQNILSFFVIIYYLNYYLFPLSTQKLFFALFVLTNLLILLFDEEMDAEDITKMFTGFMYIPFLFSFLINQKNPEAFRLVFCIAFGTDTFAYLTGYLFGKHKLCPTISPKKTVEGAVGGVFGAVLISLLYRYIIFDIDPNVTFIIFVIIASIFSQMGDLVASTWKRKYEIKDYGTIFPGHGGVLDRFDSVLFVAPIVHYYYLFFVLHYYS